MAAGIAGYHWSLTQLAELLPSPLWHVSHADRRAV